MEHILHLIPPFPPQWDESPSPSGNDQNFKTIKTFQKQPILITLLQKGFQYII